MYFWHCKVVLGINFGACMMAVCYMLAMFKYQWIMKHIRHFNLPVLYGEPTVGKTLVAHCAAWISGCQDRQIASRCTLPYLIQSLTSSSMPFVWDDPSNPEEVGQLAVDLGNGAVRGKSTEQPKMPLTGCLVTANFDLSSVVRHHSRLCVIKMVEGGHKDFWAARQLEEYARCSSSALPILLQALNTLKLEDVDDVTEYLQENLAADIRILEGVALPLAVANKVLEAAHRLEYREDMQTYMNNVLLPYLNKNQPSNMSINDVMEKALKYPEELRAASELKGESLRMIKSFLTDCVKADEQFFNKVKAAGGE